MKIRIFRIRYKKKDSDVGRNILNISNGVGHLICIIEFLNFSVALELLLVHCNKNRSNNDMGPRIITEHGKEVKKILD